MADIKKKAEEQREAEEKKKRGGKEGGCGLCCLLFFGTGSVLSRLMKRTLDRHQRCCYLLNLSQKEAKVHITFGSLD
jgi:hypothetical protein